MGPPVFLSQIAINATLGHYHRLSGGYQAKSDCPTYRAPRAAFGKIGNQGVPVINRNIPRKGKQLPRITLRMKLIDIATLDSSGRWTTPTSSRRLLLRSQYRLCSFTRIGILASDGGSSCQIFRRLQRTHGSWRRSVPVLRGGLSCCVGRPWHRWECWRRQLPEQMHPEPQR
jgi:hypothetical protein